MKRGSNKICIERKKGSTDELQLTTKGCEKFEVEPKAIKPSASTSRVVLKPTHYQVSGRIFSKAKVTNLELVVKSELRTVNLATVRDDTNGFYTFSFDALPNEGNISGRKMATVCHLKWSILISELSFVPQSEEFLFDPENIHVFVENSCHLDAVHFDAVGGFFLR